jgi:hypothetical protein
MNHYSHITYDEFFQKVVELLHKNLPAELNRFKSRRPPDKGWIVIRYPEFKNSQYELHLSSRSKNHASYFGPGPHITSAFYYKTKFGDGDAWLDALTPHVERIQRQLGRRVVIGPWGENWVWIAQSLDEESLIPERLSLLFAQFIQATYQPISLAFQSLGR